MKQETTSRNVEETTRETWSRAAAHSPEAERLDAARAEFRQVWSGRVEQRERRLAQARQGVARSRFVSSVCAAVIVCCAVGLPFSFGPSLFPYLLAGVMVAGFLLLVSLGAAIYFEHRVLNLEEDDLQPR